MQKNKMVIALFVLFVFAVSAYAQTSDYDKTAHMRVHNRTATEVERYVRYGEIDLYNKDLKSPDFEGTLVASATMEQLWKMLTFSGVSDNTAGTDSMNVTTVPAMTAYWHGLKVLVQADTVNTGTFTLNVNGLGAKTVYMNNDVAPADSYIESGGWYEVVYDTTTTASWQLITPDMNP